MRVTIAVDEALADAHLPSAKPDGSGVGVNYADHILKPFKQTLPDGRKLNGQAYVSFSKTPVTLVSAQSTANQWYIHYPPNGQWHGYGPPPSRVIWLHLAKFLDGAPPPPRWHWERRENNSWRLENRATGEYLDGFLNP